MFFVFTGAVFLAGVSGCVFKAFPCVFRGTWFRRSKRRVFGFGVLEGSPARATPRKFATDILAQIYLRGYICAGISIIKIVI